MIKKKYILPAVLSFMGMTASAQTSITFDTNDYAKISVYDQWEESPFRLGLLKGNAGVADNPDKSVDQVLGIAPNATNKVVAFQRSRHGGNAFGVRIDLKEPRQHLLLDLLKLLVLITAVSSSHQIQCRLTS